MNYKKKYIFQIIIEIYNLNKDQFHNNSNKNNLSKTFLKLKLKIIKKLKKMK